MPKRPTGQGNAVLQPGRTKFQRDADAHLAPLGWVFMRRTGHGANLYRHADGRTITITSTPTNPTNEMHRVKREARGAQTTTPNEGENVSAESAASPVTQYVAMADPFLLKPAEGQREQRARASALAGWVKRVVERHGPVVSSDLTQAVIQLGFSESMLKRARLAAGVVPFVIAGESVGKGKGSAISRIALPHQVPEGSARAGRAPTAPPENGVVPVNGEEPEAMPEPEAPEERTQGESPGVLHLRPVPRSTSPENDSENRDDEIVVPAAYVPGTITLAPEGDVAAAAMMLLESLGVKKPGDEAREALRKAHDALTAAGKAVLAAQVEVCRAQESLQ